MWWIIAESDSGTAMKTFWKLLWICAAGLLLAIILNPPDAEKPVPEHPTTQKESVKTSKEIDKALTYCLLPKAQYGQYSSYDGGKSAGALLEEGCPNEFVDWMESCHNVSGEDEKTCFTKAMIISQAAIKTFNK
jgi:hypothetical protein